ncbi:MAG: hypothetical protein KF691_13800 [Phycisphaeraceae bacterium]|nr:hypothetical protein [Phycisphaeraceae bacterium]
MRGADWRRREGEEFTTEAQRHREERDWVKARRNGGGIRNRGGNSEFGVRIGNAGKAFTTEAQRHREEKGMGEMADFGFRIAERGMERLERRSTQRKRRKPEGLCLNVAVRETVQMG